MLLHWSAPLSPISLGGTVNGVRLLSPDTPVSTRRIIEGSGTYGVNGLSERSFSSVNRILAVCVRGQQRNDETSVCRGEIIERPGETSDDTSVDRADTDERRQSSTKRVRKSSNGRSTDSSNSSAFEGRYRYRTAPGWSLPSSRSVSGTHRDSQRRRIPPARHRQSSSLPRPACAVVDAAPILPRTPERVLDDVHADSQRNTEAPRGSAGMGLHLSSP